MRSPTPQVKIKRGTGVAALVFILCLFLALPFIQSCQASSDTKPSPTVETQSSESLHIDAYMGGIKDQYYEMRKTMLTEHIIKRGISDPYVLRAMGHVPRHLFVSEGFESQAYADHPLPIAEGQTISQPYVVAMMTEAIAVRPGDQVLEIGTGSGYQAAVLAEITDEVYSVEIKEALVEFAKNNLEKAGYTKVRVKHGDGYFGWEEYAPYDAIIVTCAANHISPHLIKQLKDDGRLVIPIGDTSYFQTLTLVKKEGEDLNVTYLSDVRFVPMIGEAQK